VIPVNEHPLLHMWRDRLDAEVAQERARAARKAAREAEHASWHAAWRAYKVHRAETRDHVPLPRWWDLLAWVRFLLRLHAPGRPN